MKFTQILICLVVFTSLFLEIQGIQSQNNLLKKKSKHSAAGIIDWLFGDWRDVELQVNDQINNQQKFKGRIKHIYFDTAYTIPFGVEFQGLTEVKSGSSKNTGFLDNVLVYEKLVNQGNDPQPVLDLRFIQDCSFTDNGKDWFGDWTLYFSVVGQEKYQAQSSKPFGNLWKLKLVLPAADRNLAMTTKDKLYNACVARSKQVNQFRKNAIEAGDKYFVLYGIQANKNTSLAKSVEQGQQQSTVLKSVQSQSSLQSQQIQSQINQNQQQLQAAVQALTETQKLNEGTLLQVENYTRDLEAVKLALDGVKSSQSAVQSQIQRTQSALNEALNLQNSQKNQSQVLALNKISIQTTQEAEKAELARLVKEQEDRMAKAQAEFEAKQAENKRQQEELARQQEELARQQAAAQAQTLAAQKQAEELAQQQAAQKAAIEQQKGNIQQTSQQKQAELDKQLAENQQKNEANNQALQQSALSIEQLVLQVKSQQSQAELIDQQRQSTEKAVSDIQKKLEEKRDFADQLAAKLSIQSAFQQQQDLNLKNTQSEGQKRLAEMAAKEKAQLDLLDQSNAQVKAAQQAAAQAATDLKNAYQGFYDTINKINSIAKAAQFRTQLALEKASVNQHASELNQIISNKGANMNRRRFRLAKQQKSIQRLAKLQKKQARKIRRIRRRHL